MNIYIRTQDNDLCKYLNDAETSELLAQCRHYELRIGEYLFPPEQTPDCVVMVVSGRLDKISASGKRIGSIFGGEIDGEEYFLDPDAVPCSLVGHSATQVMLLSFDAITTFIGADSERGARIHAALNDSICLKIIRLTHIEDSND
ncbi:MAG: hypothetical protein CVU48_06810 [Candidatus Cloacimonetes bacterium HGW-Cloacimonetes-1]|jgi:hypothetical protein|nr:MAG: hypothetical protein CVU48_06810 [Candidatus Cloacimonetes bacterium HGW-Cloacimonetes-1]